ncbi:MAG: transcription-repair coupling factor [Candidatus Adiutrix sp.]|jgi:transcription-repair coupling factor (superfamily II helicase)|nr:transcription-repair coupling factor [Candidatus Adiutrix sp.]
MAEYQRYIGDLRQLQPEAGQSVLLGGLTLPALARLMVQLIYDRPQIIFAAVPGAIMAEDLAGDLAYFWPEGRDRIHLFPAYEAKPFLPQSASPDIALQRQWALSQLAAGDAPRLVVAPAAAVVRLIPDPASAPARLRRIQSGAELDFEALKKFLLENGYNPVGQVESRGDFSARGDLVDIFPAGRDLPVRVEFFGDYVESIRRFRIEDQRSVGRLEELMLAPASEFSYEPDSGGRAAERLAELAGREGWHGLLWEPLARKLREAESFSGLESWSPLFTELLPLGAALGQARGLIYEPEEFLQAGQAAWLGLANHFSRLAAEERPHLAMESLWQRPEESLAWLKQGGGWRARHLELPEEAEAGARAWRLPIELHSGLRGELVPGRGGAGFLGPLVARLKSLLGRGFETHLVSPTAEQSRRLAEMLGEYDLSPSAGLAGRRAEPGRLSLEVGQLSAGFAADFDRAAYIAESDIFGGSGRPRRRRAAADFRGLNFASLKDLSPGDFVVHNLHGIGQYQGLVTLNLSYGQKGDFLHLVYKGGDKLYVPVELFNEVGKYVGAGDRPPALDRLGGLTWGRLKERVKENIREMAEDLLKLYAARSIAPGHAYEGRDGLLTEFEAAFEYSETPDQQQAIDEVLADLAAARPMDRLVCGDAGYGKTEVAMRAAFKVVSEKKQVAVLVPTTILAEQHGRTFEARLSPWGIRCASLSRFKKPGEIRELLKRLAEGQVDVVIGTHRLLQKDVKFRDLGLLVIDEEHRFGVSDKEKLKKLRAQVDVLSMSATPIPRSLSMSLAGIRDLSSISTPPQDRLAVKTTLMKYEDEAVCEAIDRELARGGQVFLVHNRVRDIHLWADKLRRLMPLVRFGIGHGQMKEKELEEVMTLFLNRELSVWITTTIVESGLDFPSAGTIIIDQADRFGLAQLYQLRGRVGRGNQQAYCCLMVDNPDTLTSDAKKRLKALLDHSELGSGYQIAMHDLQIRGSGNILGAAQSGQVNLVGYEMYTQLMEEAIAELKGRPLEEEMEPEVAMGLPAYLPSDYVPDTESRLVMYRRLASAADFEEIGSLREEMRDRFGPPPEEARSLAAMMEIKIMLKKAKVRRLETGAGGLTLSFGPEGPANYEAVMALVMDRGRKVRLSPGGKLFVGDIRLRSGADLELVKNFLPGLL